MWFKIDYNKLAILLIPTFLRKPVLIAFLQTLISPISVLYDQWTLKRLDNIYKLNHNGQICYLRKALNDLFDPSFRRIIIDDGSQFRRIYIYNNAENQPKYLGEIFLQPSTNFEDTGVDFKVIVPRDFNLESIKYQMNALVDFYKLASKRYVIEKV